MSPQLLPDHAQALLALADGTVFHGASIGAEGETTGEVVFNTALTGYQEILTDPSYCRQIVTLTYPHIGNYGSSPEDVESRQVFAAGLVVKDVPPLASNFRSTASLGDYLRAANTVAIAGIDTRRLTRLLRTGGAQNGCIVALARGEKATPAVIEAAHRQGALGAVDGRAGPGPGGERRGSPTNGSRRPGRWAAATARWPRRSAMSSPTTTASSSTSCGCWPIAAAGSRWCRRRRRRPRSWRCGPTACSSPTGPATRSPATTRSPPPANASTAAVPTFGICLGHQIMALACGARTYKMKFGHHGANHPVKDLDSGRVSITSQNHGFAVDPKSLPATLRPTHVSLFDGTLQGLAHVDKPAFCFQGHPEASPGPHDIGYLFDRFVALMDTAGRAHA